MHQKQSERNVLVGIWLLIAVAIALVMGVLFKVNQLSGVLLVVVFTGIISVGGFNIHHIIILRQRIKHEEQENEELIDDLAD